MTLDRHHRRWTVSSRCSSGTCVGVQIIEDSVLIADTKQLADPTMTVLSVHAADWAVFVDGLKGSPDRLGQATLSWKQLPEGDIELAARDIDAPLRFSEGEWNAFLAGVKSGEFDVVQNGSSV